MVYSSTVRSVAAIVAGGGARARGGLSFQPRSHEATTSGNNCQSASDESSRAGLILTRSAHGNEPTTRTGRSHRVYTRHEVHPRRSIPRAAPRAVVRDVRARAGATYRRRRAAHERPASQSERRRSHDGVCDQRLGPAREHVEGGKLEKLLARPPAHAGAPHVAASHHPRLDRGLRPQGVRAPHRKFNRLFFSFIFRLFSLLYPYGQLV